MGCNYSAPVAVAPTAFSASELALALTLLAELRASTAKPPLPVKEAPPSSGLSPHTVRWVCPPLPPLPQLSPALSATRTDAIDEQQLPPGSPTSTELHSWKPPLPPLPEARLEGCYRCAAGRSVHVLSTRA